MKLWQSVLLGIAFVLVCFGGCFAVIGLLGAAFHYFGMAGLAITLMIGIGAALGVAMFEE